MRSFRAFPQGAQRALYSILAVGALVATGACSSQSNTTQGATGGTDKHVKYAVAGEPGQLDPTLANTFSSVVVYEAMCETLYAVSPEATMVPRLAASEPEFSEDRKTVTVKLRQGVKFADGTPFNAEAVKVSIERHLTHPSSQRKNELAALESVAVADEHTVLLAMKKPISPGAFSVMLSDRAGLVMSPTALKSAGDNFGDSPVCVGPFKFDSRAPQNFVKVVKDPNYYDAAKIQLESVTFQVIADSTIRVTNLRSGDIDVVERVPTTDVAGLDGKNGTKIIKSNGIGFIGLEVNSGNTGKIGKPGKVEGPLQDPKVRKALELSIDREALNKVVYNGQYAGACGFIAPSSALASEPATACTPHDPQKAKELLKEAGVTTPVKVSVLLSNTPEFSRIAQALKSMVQEGGFDLQIDARDSTAVLAAATAGEFQLHMNTWSGRIDPDANISRFVSTGSPSNYGNFSNPKVDEMVTAARSEPDVDKRRELYGKLTVELAKELPMIYLVRPSFYAGVRDSLEGLTAQPNGVVDFRAARVTGRG
ncbi:peptide/nickel transport system substrate-binding protein [Sinosporangium album]|uniref:Peptide/nickel transport system substrate-binding protein n=1 Tax=Sinosporangium album TaxID=504805 RepID=A0A1G8IYG3_9ACTN|nr:ABC transporter substrate-binding protein [Sinosporangium album]SDI24088.1 peptide/nickel transport system substrate-binding protein [Sinosporangium album]